MSIECPCHSGNSYQECCAPYHRREAAPPNALALMRSRYSAYAKGYVDYILKTTHPKHPDCQVDIKKRREQVKMFCQQTEFLDLEILSFEEGVPYSYVTFRAHLTQNGKDCSFTEKSRFEKIDGIWYYSGFNLN